MTCHPARKKGERGENASVPKFKFCICSREPCRARLIYMGTSHHGRTGVCTAVEPWPQIILEHARTSSSSREAWRVSLGARSRGQKQYVARQDIIYDKSEIEAVLGHT